MIPHKGPWTEQQNDLLKALVLNGASVVRAAAVFKRTIISVRGQARKLGTPFQPHKIKRKKWEGTPSNEWRRF